VPLVLVLDEHKIEKIIEHMKSSKLCPTGLSIRYNHHEKNIVLNSSGVAGDTNDDHDFFENFKENLLYADLSWLGPLCRTFRSHLNADIHINPDGSIKHDLVKVSVTLNIPSEVGTIHKYLYPRFKSFVKFRQFVKQVEFKGHQYAIRHIIFHLEIDAKIVNRILNDNQINHQILAQWMATVDTLVDHNAGRYSFWNKIPVINGKMNPLVMDDCIILKFNLSGDLNGEE
jgi:hypothetical protein